MVSPALYEGFGLPVIEAMAADAVIIFTLRVPTQITEAIRALVQDDATCDLSGRRQKAMIHPVMFRSLWAYRGFVWSSVQREFNGKYRESLLGAFWVAEVLPRLTTTRLRH